MGFYHVDQAGLKLLTSSDPPASASQSARITGVSHHAQQYMLMSVFACHFPPFHFPPFFLCLPLGSFFISLFYEAFVMCFINLDSSFTTGVLQQTTPRAPRTPPQSLPKPLHVCFLVLCLQGHLLLRAGALQSSGLDGAEAAQPDGPRP